MKLIDGIKQKLMAIQRGNTALILGTLPDGPDFYVFFKPNDENCNLNYWN